MVDAAVVLLALALATPSFFGWAGAIPGGDSSLCPPGSFTWLRAAPSILWFPAGNARLEAMLNPWAKSVPDPFRLLWFYKFYNGLLVVVVFICRHHCGELWARLQTATGAATD